VTWPWRYSRHGWTRVVVLPLPEAPFLLRVFFSRSGRSWSKAVYRGNMVGVKALCPWSRSTRHASRQAAQRAAEAWLRREIETVKAAIKEQP